MLQAAFPNGLLLDLLSHEQDLRAAAVVDVGGRQVAEALVVAYPSGEGRLTGSALG